MSQIKFPMHDDFYFTIQDPILIYRDVIGFPNYIKKTIFTPDNKQIFSDYCKLQTNFLACRTNAGSYLIVPFTQSLFASEQMYTLEGLALCTKQLGLYEYHPYGHNFFGGFDYALNIDETMLRELATKNNVKSKLVNSDGLIVQQDWVHKGYNLRTINKSKVKKWIIQNQRAGD